MTFRAVERRQSLHRDCVPMMKTAFTASLFSALLATVNPAETEEIPLQLAAYRVDGTTWQYACVAGIEVLSQNPVGVSRQTVRSLVRGTDLFPRFILSEPRPTTKLILLRGVQSKVGRPGPMGMEQANLRYWGHGYSSGREGYLNLVDGNDHVLALNYGGLKPFEIIGDRARFLLRSQKPRFPAWVTEGLIGDAGCFARVIGMPHSESVRLPKVSWPDDAVEAGVLPAEALEFPEFDMMFDALRSPALLPEAETKKFKFQAAVFARWSLFGPVTNGRNRNAYWAYAELARRQGATEELFRECYGMDWARARTELRAFIKPNSLGVIEVRMPHVMRDVPEVDAMQFREATPEEVRRILGEFNRLRALQPKSDVKPDS